VQQAAVIVSTRRVTAEDDGFLRDLFAESRPDLDLLPEAVRAQLITLQYESRRDQYRASAPGAIDSIVEVEVDGHVEPVGRCYFWQQPHEHRLLDLAIRPAWRGRGVGSTVLERLRAEAGRAGVPLRLTVWADNGDALRLYLRHGFVPEDGDPAAGPPGYRWLRWPARGGS
jgi:ribosomal protein S18 acetylase RimI-like enzyme